MGGSRDRDRTRDRDRDRERRSPLSRSSRGVDREERASHNSLNSTVVHTSAHSTVHSTVYSVHSVHSAVQRPYRRSNSKEHYSHSSRRSPDYYRNDSSEDDSYDDSRRHRSTQDYDDYDSERRNHHKRDRSRSRDRDRERDRNRYYSDDHFSATNDEFAHNNYDRDKDRDRERPHYQRDRREEIPNNTIMIRGLAAYICENDIVNKLAEHNLQAKDIRLMRKKETGASRGFAFVEFSNINHAIQWKDLTEGIVNFGDECQASVHYSIPKDSFGADKNIMKNDWCCYKCGVNNFKRRDECFKCGTPKEESDANDTGEEISLTPTNALLLRNLAPHTTEERILTILGSITALPIKSIRILKDLTYGVSRGMCLVELHTTLEASQLFTLISSMSPGFIIDDSQVTINYGKRNNATAAQISTNAANAAIVALAAAQWTNQTDEHSKQYDNHERNHNSSNNNSNMGLKKLGTVCIKGVEYSKYESPVVSSFQYDESSGYYYDSTTGFYYDSNTQYYYNPQTQKYIYWDETNHIYLPIDSSAEQRSDEEKKDKPKDAKQDKVKIAKKIAKDMEKWAKTLNQKKDSARSWIPANDSVINNETIQSSYSSKTSTADAGFSLLEQHINQGESELFAVEPLRVNAELKSMIDEMKPHSGAALSPYEMIKAEERRLTDWDKLACLLCKRQFSTPELLTKHQQLSDLHKSNMMILKRSKLSEEQIEELERTENEAGYRDRAKERRKKYGIPETPEMSKLKSKYLSELEERAASNELPVQTTNTPISDDNIGNKMLKAMGWTEGMGLGRSNQGMSNIIEVERRVGGVGLGIRANSSTASSNESYKDAVRRTMQQRFREIADKE